MTDPLEALRDRIDLARIPFTDRGSRLLVFAAGDGLWIGAAEYETDPRAGAPVPRLTFVAADGGDALPLRVSFRPDRLECRAGEHAVTVAFADAQTLVLALPAAVELRLHVRGEPAARGRLTPVAPSSQHVAVTGRWVGAHALPEGGTLVRLAPEAGAVALRIAPTAVAVPARADADAAQAAAQARWQAWFAGVPAVPAALRTAHLHAWWVLAANLVRLRRDPGREGMVPSKLGYVGVWNWDACFHAVGLRYRDPMLAADQLRIVLDAQQPDGMLPDVIWDAGVLASAGDLGRDDRERSRAQLGGRDEPAATPITKPPVAAWAAWKVFEAGGDRAFLADVYGPLSRTQRWWLEASDPDRDGLPDYTHHYSSGLDDSPLWDGGGPLGATDLVAHLVGQADHLALIAAELGRPAAEVACWRAQASALTGRLVALRWDARAGAFWARRGDGSVRVRTPFGLLPLGTGRLPAPIADRLVADLIDPRRFWTPHPVPTVAADEPAFDPRQMWRGPVWMNVNHLLVGALRRAGYRDVAAELRERTLALVVGTPDCCEYYDPRSGERAPGATSSFGWTAALFSDLALTSP